MDLWYYIIVEHGRLQEYTDVSGHVTLHFEFQQPILGVQYSLYYNTLVMKGAWY